MEFTPKTRKQYYAAIAAQDYDKVPSIVEDVYYPSTVEGTFLKDVTLTFTLSDGNYISELSTSAVAIHENTIVEVNGNEIPKFSSGTVYQNGALCYNTLTALSGDNAFIIISIGSTAPVGTFVASCKYLTARPDMSKLAPKTRKEKYLAKDVELYDSDLPDPKTVDEYYQAITAGWEPAEDDSGEDDDPGIVDNGGK